MGRDYDVFTSVRSAGFAVLASLVLFGCGGGGGGGTPTQPNQPNNPGNTPSQPTITSFSPVTGSIGTQVIVSGSNFASVASENTVRFNGVSATVLSSSSTELVAIVPSGASSGPLQVITAGGTATSSASFTLSVTTPPGTTWVTRSIGPGVDDSLSPTAIAHNGTRIVSVGSGSFEASSDARVWTTTRELASGEDVAWNGQLFVAVDGPFTIYTSPDGLTWNTRFLPSGNSSDLTAVAAGPSLWVAVGEDGAIFSSNDAITWTARSSGTTRELVDVVWAANRFVAVGAEGTVVTSPDGINWTLPPPPTADSFTAVGGSTSLIVAATYPFSGSQLKLLTSVDGVTWVTAASDLAVFNTITYAGGRYVAAGFYETATSIDGVVWNSSAVLPAILNSVVHVNGEYIAVGSDGSNSNAVLASSDGLSWRIIQSAHDLHRIARSPQDGRLVAVGISHVIRTSMDNGATWSFAPLGTLSDNYPFIDLVWSQAAGAFVGHVQVAANQYAYTSVDGASWTQRGYMPCYGALAASPTRLVNVGFSLSGACVSISDNGASWTAVTPPSSIVMKGVFWSGSQFVGVGNSGLIATSPDGQNWTVRTSNVTATLHDGASSASTLVVVGANGTIVTSSDAGATWTPRSSGVSSSLRHATFSGTEFLVVGGGGTLLKSSNGESWSKETTPETSDFGDILWVPGASQRVVVGDSGLATTSP